MAEMEALSAFSNLRAGCVATLRLHNQNRPLMAIVLMPIDRSKVDRFTLKIGGRVFLNFSWGVDEETGQRFSAGELLAKHALLLEGFERDAQLYVPMHGGGVALSAKADDAGIAWIEVEVSRDADNAALSQVKAFAVYA